MLRFHVYPLIIAVSLLFPRLVLLQGPPFIPSSATVPIQTLPAPRTSNSYPNDASAAFLAGRSDYAILGHVLSVTPEQVQGGPQQGVSAVVNVLCEYTGSPSLITSNTTINTTSITVHGFGFYSSQCASSVTNGFTGLFFLSNINQPITGRAITDLKLADPCMSPLSLTSDSLNSLWSAVTDQSKVIGGQCLMPTVGMSVATASTSTTKSSDTAAATTTSQKSAATRNKRSRNGLMMGVLACLAVLLCSIM